MTQTIINPGMARRLANEAIAHQIEAFSLVELSNCSPEFDGLRLYVQAQERDCDGTPLYAVTANVALVNRNMYPWQIEDEWEKKYALRHRFEVHHGFTEDSLTVIQDAVTVIQRVESGELLILQGNILVNPRDL